MQGRQAIPGVSSRGKATFVVKAKLASRDSLTQGSKGGGRGGVGGGRVCFNTESQEGGSVPHPGLDAASSGKVSSPGPGSPSPAQPQIDSAQRPDWPETEQ